jgi:hypothetical protein
VDLSADLPPPRRPLFFPVVIATVLLSIIGMSAGLVLGSQHKQAQTAAPPSEPGQITAPAAAPTTTSSADPCPQQTQVMGQKYGATGVLRIALQLRTKSSTVWICQDDAGKLFYHANRGGADGEWVEGQTALFMAGVQRDGEGGYTVTASDGNTFSINSHRLYIVHKKDDKVEVQTAVN